MDVEKKVQIKYNNFVFSILDLMCIIYIFLPLYEQNIERRLYTVSLINLECLNDVVKILFYIVLIYMFIIGIVEFVFNFVNVKRACNVFNIISIVSQIVSIFVFALSKQSYIVVCLFMMIIVKIGIIIKDYFKVKN